MPSVPLPRRFRRNLRVQTTDEMWRKIITEGDPLINQGRHFYRLLPASPRCKSCNVPFAGVGGAFLRTFAGFRQSPKNPRFCNACSLFAAKYPGGAEVVITMLFVDVRGSTALAEKMPATEFSHLMNRFYETAMRVLVRADAFIDKLVGDEVTALFFPGYAGNEHARRAVHAGQELLRATGYGTSAGPWIPVGVGVHSGEAWVGAIAGAGGSPTDFTALGDNVNIAARLASKAGAGEVLASEVACLAAHIDTAGLEQRALELKGKSEPVHVRVLH